MKNITNKKGEVVDTITTYEGEPGNDLVTTIDIELQARAEQIVEEKFVAIKIISGSPIIRSSIFCDDESKYW